MSKRLLYTALFAVALVITGWSYLFGYPRPPVDAAWELSPAETVDDAAVTVRFSGTTTLLFSDGDTQWMIDGWFSRPGPLRMLFGEVAPDLDAVDFGLQQNGVDTLAAVIPIHSHYDHAMDSPEVARRTGARLIGSAASANIARGWGLPEAQIQVVADGEEVALGDFRVRFLESRHMEYPDPEMVERLITQSDIPEPLVPPASIYDYKLGKAYVLHVRHPAGSFLVVGSAGFVPGQLRGLDVDVVFLGVGGLGSKTDDYREAYWRETVGSVDPERVVLTHWDSLTGPLDGPMTGEVRIAGTIMGGESELLDYLRRKAGAGEVLQTLPRFLPVQLLP